MISSSNFFKKTLFTNEEKQEQPLRKLLLHPKDTLTPWSHHQEIALNKPSKPIFSDKNMESSQKNKRRYNYSLDFPSNLFPSKATLELPPIAVASSPKTPSTPFMVKHSLSNNNRKQKQENSRQKISYQSISIHEFLDQQRKELAVLRQNKKNKSAMGHYEQSDFLVNRNNLKAFYKENHSKTLDLRKELIDPLELYQRNSIISLNHDLMSNKGRNRYKESADKYKPLKEYHHY